MTLLELHQELEIMLKKHKNSVITIEIHWPDIEHSATLTDIVFSKRTGIILIADCGGGIGK